MKALVTTVCSLFVCCVVFTGCYYDKYQEVYPTPASATDKCDTAKNPATFSGGVKTILTQKCASTGCHNASTLQSGYDLSLYATDSAASERIRIRVQQNTMPPASSQQMTDCEKNQLYYWLNHGSRNN